VFGYDANYELQSESVDLNGTSAVTTTNTYIGLYRMKVTSAGSGGTTAGTLTASIGGTGVGSIAPVNGRSPNQTLIGWYMIPAGYTGYIVSAHAKIGRSNSAYATLSLRVTPFGEVSQVRDFEIITTEGTGGTIDEPFPIATAEEKSIVQVDVEEVSATISASCRFQILCLKND
jgi:hypothetical protein